MTLKKLCLKFLFTVIIFSVETLLQVGIVTLFVIYIYEQTISVSSFINEFFDTLNYLGGVKLVFFLPLYLLYYLAIRKSRIVSWVDLNHLKLSGIALAITAMLLPVFTYYGTLMTLLCLVITMLMNLMIKPLWNMVNMSHTDEQMSTAG